MDNLLGSLQKVLAEGNFGKLAVPEYFRDQAIARQIRVALGKIAEIEEVKAILSHKKLIKIINETNFGNAVSLSNIPQKVFFGKGSAWNNPYQLDKTIELATRLRRHRYQATKRSNRTSGLRYTGKPKCAGCREYLVRYHHRAGRWRRTSVSRPEASKFRPRSAWPNRERRGQLQIKSEILAKMLVMAVVRFYIYRERTKALSGVRKEDISTLKGIVTGSKSLHKKLSDLGEWGQSLIAELQHPKEGMRPSDGGGVVWDYFIETALLLKVVAEFAEQAIVLDSEERLGKGNLSQVARDEFIFNLMVIYEVATGKTSKPSTKKDRAVYYGGAMDLIYPCLKVVDSDSPEEQRLGRIMEDIYREKLVPQKLG